MLAVVVADLGLVEHQMVMVELEEVVLVVKEREVLVIMEMQIQEAVVAVEVKIAQVELVGLE
tara:strand:- start:61 stop:246 length:186 start_codon:yes stop_codon:yes gene_type:complete